MVARFILSPSSVTTVHWVQVPRESPGQGPSLRASWIRGGRSVRTANARGKAVAVAASVLDQDTVSVFKVT